LLNRQLQTTSPAVYMSLLDTEMESETCRSRLLPNRCTFAPRPFARSAARGGPFGVSCTEIPRKPLPADVPVLGLNPGNAATLWPLPVPLTVTGISVTSRF